MRVSQRDVYSNMLARMNRSSYEIMKLYEQQGSQKKVNTPSDDPVGTARILGYRDSLAALDQYRTNVDTAKGWLGLADQTMMQVNTIMTRAKALAEQGATGTLSADNRAIIADEMRQLFNQMLTLSNVEYEGMSIFAGHKTKDNAFKQVLNADLFDNGNMTPTAFGQVSGQSEHSVLVQFLENGTITGGAADADIDYRFSSDGGLTWSGTKTLAAGDTTLDVEGARVELSGNVTITGSGVDNDKMNVGSWLRIRPAAEYMGDDEDGLEIDVFADAASTVDANESIAQGYFEKDVLVKIDDTAAPLTYSYSLDNGNSWTTGQTTTTTPPKLLIPGGSLELRNGGGGNPTLNIGDQFFIRPNRARMNLEIGIDEHVQINNIGKDIFGGLYKGEVVSHGKEAKNTFETLGKLVAAFESNDQSGIQQGLEDLKFSQQHMNTKLAGIGARENRLKIADTFLIGLEDNQKKRVSKIEDVDVSKLMTDMAKQSMIYEAVLRSSSMIMKMSMVNYM